MSLQHLNDEKTCTARLFSGEGGINTINGNFGRPFALYGKEACVDLTAQETLNLLTWLEEHQVRLEQLVSEQKREELREETESVLYTGLREALDFHHDIERARGKLASLLTDDTKRDEFPLGYAVTIIEKYEEAVRTFLGESNDEGKEA